MNQPQQRYARAWQLSSTILMSLALAATTWLISTIGLAIFSQLHQLSYTSDLILWLASLTSLILLVTVLISKWDSKGSSKLYTSELILGGLFILAGAIYIYYSYTLAKAHTPTGSFSGLKYAIMMVIGIYISCTGTLAALAGFLGMLSNPRMRENG